MGTIITVFSRSNWSSRGFHVRLMTRDESSEYYLRCSARCWLDAETPEDIEAKSWNCAISTAEAEQWLKALRHQNLKLAGPPPLVFATDGMQYGFTCFGYGNTVSLEWDNHTPEGWEVVGLIKDRFLEIANPRPDAQRQALRPTTFNLARHIFQARWRRFIWHCQSYGRR